jgi:16S rRNA (adenine1518-N6/adenine1519-N6)-dimethyltransferase
MAVDPNPKRTLDRCGLRPKKHFGQNFLADAHLAERIARLATTPSGGTVVEIGAGLGALTTGLVARAARVVAIERDRDLVPVLREDLADAIADGRLEVLEADAKEADYPALLTSGPEPRVIAGNLPYQITGPLLERLVDLGAGIARAVALVQLEVADRLAAAHDTENYGALTVFVQARFTVERALVVRRGAFYPQPNVDSAVVVLTPRAEPIARETEVFRAVVHGAFRQRRKKLRNAWRGVAGLPEEALLAAAERAGIKLDRRGETLSVAEFARMARELGA